MWVCDLLDALTLWEMRWADGDRQVLLRGCRSVEIDVWDGKAGDDPDDDGRSTDEAHHGFRERLGLRKSNDHGQDDHHRSLKDKILGHHESAKEVQPAIQSSSSASQVDIMSQRVAPWRSGIRYEPRVLHG